MRQRKDGNMHLIKDENGRGDYIPLGVPDFTILNTIHAVVSIHLVLFIIFIYIFI